MTATKTPKLTLKLNSGNLKSLEVLQKLKSASGVVAASEAKKVEPKAIKSAKIDPVKPVSKTVEVTGQVLSEPTKQQPTTVGSPPLADERATQTQGQQKVEVKPKKKSTAIRNPYVPNKALPEWLQRYNGLLHEVNRRYSRLFVGKEVKPLAIGIHKEIQDKLKWDNETTKFFFKTYTRTKKYKAALVEGAKRYDIQGKAFGEVTKAEASWLPKEPVTQEDNKEGADE